MDTMTVDKRPALLISGIIALAYGIASLFLPQKNLVVAIASIIAGLAFLFVKKKMPLLISFYGYCIILAGFWGYMLYLYHDMHQNSIEFIEAIKNSDKAALVQEYSAASLISALDRSVQAKLLTENTLPALRVAFPLTLISAASLLAVATLRAMGKGCLIDEIAKKFWFLPGLGFLFLGLWQIISIKDDLSAFFYVTLFYLSALFLSLGYWLRSPISTVDVSIILEQ